MRSFDRGYSEVTFCKIAVEVKASEAIIHKEFHLSSADPHIVGPEKSVPVGQTSYFIADQLADIGMEGKLVCVGTTVTTNYSNSSQSLKAVRIGWN